MIKMILKMMRACILVLAAPKVLASPAADWVYLDLGEVVVTGDPTSGYHFVPGALAALEQMRAEGKKLALLSNIPEAWGSTCGDKFQGLKVFLEERLREPTPLDWAMFDAVILPPFDRYRKPHALMFISALHNACQGRVMFIGESAEEIDAASQLGMATFWKESVDTPLPVGADLDELLATGFTYEYPEACDFTDIVSDALLPQDVGSDIKACVVNPRNVFP